VREEVAAARAAAQDVHQQEVDERQQQRVDDQPELPEDRVEVLRAQVRARQLEGEVAPLPERAQVRADGREPHLVRLVHLALARERGGCRDLAHDGG
jgi:hypothetical protein